MKKEDEVLRSPEQPAEPPVQESLDSVAAPETSAWADGSSSADEGQAPWQALQDRYLRLAAEFENYKKRTARETPERIRTASADLLLELLEIADNFERALGAAHDDSPYVQGVSMIREQLLGFLTRRGVEKMQVEGERFNPEVHEALFKVPSETPAGCVSSVLRAGYTFHGRTLRPAQVAVSTGPPGWTPADEQNGEMEK